MSEYGFAVEVGAGYDEAVLRTRLALRGEGFSVLTEAHVGGMLGPEAGEERQYLILGAYNPVVSEERLGPDIQMAVHLPCNLVIQETGATAVVAALDPGEGYAESDLPTELAAAARSALERVLIRVAGGQ